MTTTTTRTISDLPPLSTNHMVRQRLENEALKAELASLRQSLADLKTHFARSKFRDDPYINVGDVIRWLNQADDTANEANGNVYTIARMRQVLTTVEPEEFAQDFYKLTAERVTSQSYEHSVSYVLKSNLDFALDVLKANGFLSVEVDSMVSSHESKWRYERRVRLV